MNRRCFGLVFIARWSARFGADRDSGIATSAAGEQRTVDDGEHVVREMEDERLSRLSCRLVLVDRERAGGPIEVLDAGLASLAASTPGHQHEPEQARDLDARSPAGFEVLKYLADMCEGASLTGAWTIAIAVPARSGLTA